MRAPGAFARNDQLSPADAHAANTPPPIVKHDPSSGGLLVWSSSPILADAHGHGASAFARSEAERPRRRPRGVQVLGGRAALREAGAPRRSVPPRR